jgi:hypothetical protein
MVAFNCSYSAKTNKVAFLSSGNRITSGSDILIKSGGLIDSVNPTETQDTLKEIKGYRIYQTFNEYKLQGIGTTNIKFPYVYVRDEKNAIYVIKSNENQIIKYLNKGNYWYSHWKIEIDCNSNWKDKSIQSWKVCERYIFNDSILDYIYYLDKDKESKEISRSVLSVFVRTGKKDMLLAPVFKIKNIDNPFSELKFFVENYKNTYTPDSYINYRKSMFIEVEKEISSDTLYNYSKKGDRTKIQYIKLNSMGEYDIYSPNSRNTLQWRDKGFR